jgi:hypothetical protein
MDGSGNRVPGAFSGDIRFLFSFLLCFYHDFDIISIKILQDIFIKSLADLLSPE